jgi:hypothetical protein
MTSKQVVVFRKSHSIELFSKDFEDGNFERNSYV